MITKLPEKRQPLAENRPTEANARLVAAAPELLEACENVLYWLAAHADKSYNVAAAVESARKAVFAAKANL